MNDNFNITIDLTPLKQELAELKELIAEHKSSLTQQRKEQLQLKHEEPLKATEIAKKLQVSRVTISNWVKAGYIPSKVIGGRRYFILSEVLDNAPTPKGKVSKG